MLFEFLDLALIGRDHGVAGSFDNAVQKLIDFLLDSADIARQCCSLHFHVRQFCVPQIAEHFECQMKQAFGRLEFGQQRLELAFHLFLANGFAIGHAAARIAEVIRIKLATAFRPAGRIRLAAIGAGDKSTQREGVTEVLASGRFARPVAAILRGQPCLQADQPLMLARRQSHAPIVVGDVARVDRPGQNLADTFGMNFAFLILRPCGLRFQEAFDLEDGFKAPAGQTFDRIGDNRGIWFVAHQHLAVARLALDAIAERTAERPVTVLQTRLHPVSCLLGILLALMLRHRCKQVFDEDGIGILAKFDRRAFEFAACLAQEIA